MAIFNIDRMPAGFDKHGREPESLITQIKMDCWVKNVLT